MKIGHYRKAAVTAVFAVCGGLAQAADWSDTSIAYRHGNEFGEPYNADKISKDIISFTHASGYKYGSNFFNIDLLMSDSHDPANYGTTNGAQETYVVYRHTLDFGKVSGKTFEWGPIRGFGFTAGFDYNNKNDVGYNSKKRMLVAGPTLMMDVPGFLNISLLALWESNAPNATYPSGKSTDRYAYATHPALAMSWGIPFSVGGLSLSFDGYANFIAAKGKNEFGGDTVDETNIDMQLMYDASHAVGARNNTFRVGLEYQYWKNKFGNDASNPSVGPGGFARTPMIRMEYHF